MKYTPELLKAVDHCQHRSFITNRYTGKRIAVDCGQCDYCIHKRAQKASMRVKTAGSAYEHCWFVTLTYDNEHIPLFNCEVYYSEYDDVLSDSGVVHGYEKHAYVPVSQFCTTDPQRLQHIYFTQVQGTVPYNRELGQYEPVKDNWFVSVDAMRAFIHKTQSATPYGKDGEFTLRYGNNLIPFLNYVDVQNYIKRLRRHLDKYTNEKISFYAVGEYGPVHFRPHFHLLLFFNSQEIADVLRECHNKSWKLGRSDIQRSNGGCASYVASYVNSLASAPSLYRSCRAFRPRSRASLGFFEKGQTFDECEDAYAQIEAKIDSVINGREYNFNGIVVNSTPPLSYIRSLLPRFSGARYDDPVAISRVIHAVASAPKRIARFGIIDYDSNSILSIVRAYYQYITLNHILTDDDKIILHNARCLTRFVNSSSDVDVEYFVNKLYRLFLYVSKFLRNWHLPGIGGDLHLYTSRVNYIIKKGIEYEKKKDYEALFRNLYLQSQNSDIVHYLFALPDQGQEVDFLSYAREKNQDLLQQLRFRSATFCRNMIKHKKLNDANDIFNQMV